MLLNTILTVNVIFMLRFFIIIVHGMMITGDDSLVTPLIVIIPGTLPGRLNHLR